MMNRCKLSFVILYLYVVTWPLVLLHAQKNPFLEQIRNFPQEKIHVTTDRDAYIAGDTVWLRAHCVDAATLEPLTASRYVYVELRTTDNLLVRRIKILQRGGVYAGYLPLPATLAQDEYVLCAYTLYMRNLGGDYLFSKPLSVNPYRQPEKRRRRTAAGPFDVAFFPEGGYLIDGQPCRVGFKALGRDGLSRQVTGTVRDDRGRTVARFASRHAGMGSFEFTPRPGRRYTAECVQTSGGKARRFDLPEANDLTFVLRVEPNDTSFVVSVRSAKKWRPQGLKLLVHRCGTQCYYKEWNPQHASLTFLRDELPGGLYQILLLSPTGEAYSERLVFNRRDDEAEVTMRQEGTLRQRSKVTLHFEVRDTKRRPAQGDFAVAVTDRKAAAPVAAAGIYSTLMLSSELRGVIEDPDWYFAPDNAQGDEGLDELLLTQGWRRYDVPKLLRNEYEEPYYPLEAGQEIAGRIERTAMFSKKKKLDRYTMRLLVPRSGYATSAPIAEDGSFALNGFDFPDSTLFVLRPAAAKGLLPEAYVKVARDSFPEVGTLPRVPAQEQKKPYIAQARYYIEQRGQTDMRNILIDTVYVTHHKRLESTRPEHRLAARTWTAEQIKDSGAGTILDFIARMPGMSVVGRQVSYRGYRPGFMVDGRLEETVGEMNPVRAFRSTGMGRNHKTQTRLPPIPDPGGWIDFTGMNYSNTNSAQQSTGGNKRQIQYIDDFDNVPDILYYPLEIVSRIDLIEGGNMVLWGVSHWKQAGIISITTKKGKELDDATRTLPARDVEFVSPLGYQTPAEFYAPAYATEKARRSMVPDYRTTLYWNPTVKLDDTGQATVEFYTSDAPADYDITIEGITQTGKIVRTVKIITE